MLHGTALDSVVSYVTWTQIHRQEHDVTRHTNTQQILGRT